MAYDGYACLRTQVDGGVAWVTIDHPPINLFDMALIQDMLRIGEALGTAAARLGERCATQPGTWSFRMQSWEAGSR